MFLKSVTAATLFFTVAIGPAQAADTAAETATITRIIGSTKLLTNPSKNANGPAPRALFEGTYYTEKKCIVGDQVRIGDIIQTSNGSRARLIYPNGDQVTVSSSTAYIIGSKEKKSNIELIMGSIRMTVDKEGPRNGMEVRTRTMAMGIRGTDFYVSARSNTGASEVSVFRGKVDAKSLAPNSKKISVAAGYVASIAAPPAKVEGGGKETAAAQPEPVALKPMNKEYIVMVDKNTTVERPASIALVSDDPKAKEQLEKIALLETKAIEATVKDIKTHDPELFAAISKSKATVDDADKLKRASSKKLFMKAPSATGPGQKKDLKENNDDIYDKYYKD